jgi:hypothetical protein
MGWIKVCDTDSLSNGDLIGFDYNNIKKILITKLQDKIYVSRTTTMMKIVTVLTESLLVKVDNYNLCTLYVV